MNAPNANHLYSVNDAVEILAVKSAAFLQALARIPTLRHKREFTIEELGVIDGVLKAELARKGGL